MVEAFLLFRFTDGIEASFLVQCAYRDHVLGPGSGLIYVRSVFGC